jgi:hydroxymethylbilane synthase
MRTKKIIVATRQSPLALWQSRFVAQQLQRYDSRLIIQLAPIATQGDRDLHLPLDQATQRGLFVEALEQELLARRADIAVHSVKDLPVADLPGLTFSTFGCREEAGEALISHQLSTLEALPPRARVGTSSQLRQQQLAYHRPDVILKALRGNVTSRLQQWRQGEYDALILAVAGLKRLGLQKYISAYLPLDTLLPAPGQGALAVQYRTEDHEIQALVSHFNELETSACVVAERAVLRRFSMEGPAVGAYAHPQGPGLQLRAVVISAQGERFSGSLTAPWDRAALIGWQLAETLLAQLAQGSHRDRLATAS